MASALSWSQGRLVPFPVWISAVLYCQVTTTVGSAMEDAEGGLASPGTWVLPSEIKFCKILQIEMLSYSEERAAPVQYLALLLLILISAFFLIS